MDDGLGAYEHPLQPGDTTTVSILLVMDDGLGAEGSGGKRAPRPLCLNPSCNG